MVLSKLLKQFPTAIQCSTESIGYFHFYIGEELYGIPDQHINDKERSLIEVFTEITDAESSISKRWLQFLHGTQAAPPEQLQASRLLFVQTNAPSSLAETLHSTFEEILAKKIIPIYYRQNEFLCFIEPFKLQEEGISFEPYIDVLQDDLNYSLRIFTTDRIDAINDIPAIFQWYQRYESTIWSYTNAHTLNNQTILVPMLQHALSKVDKTLFVESTLKEAVHNQELLYTVKRLIELNSNVSLAAKHLYVHRNTIQYRLDKFQELTAKDIRQFNDMLEVYMAIVFLNHV